MDSLYFVLIGMLFVLAIFDLTVGVSNDAVNFLNSSIGSKALNVKFLLALASIGVFVGATFSSGMMDIARHGIFQPQHYTFVEISTILIAVMLTDVVLLDTFNSLGMPTSTTVSMVFELLGASVAIASIKLLDDAADLSLFDLINTEKAFSVIMAIFVSVAIAFTVGAIVQYISRLVFTFAYKKRLKYFIGIFSGISLTSIFYFIIVKGLKNMAFMDESIRNAISQNENTIIVVMLIAFTILSQLLHVVGVNMLKVIIALGTFSLALAFAGNDLVNFIGVPLTGLSSIQHLVQDGGNPETYMMTALCASEPGQWYLLLAAGVIMVCALLFSKKAKNVLKTSVSLSSQNSTEEIFGTNPIARAIVRGSHSVGVGVMSKCPESLRRWLNGRFDTNRIQLEQEDAAFDLIRASVNLMLASSLIALGTSLKLPLSTTYVTFMVAMGSSLADRAWSRETAVYRITGVLSVIGGWFATAFVAFACSCVVATVLHFGGIPAKFIVFGVVIAILIRSMFRYKKNAAQKDKSSERFERIMQAGADTDVFPLIQEYNRQEWYDILRWESECFREIINGFLRDDLSKLKTVSKQLKILRKHIEHIRRQGTLCSKKLAAENRVLKNFFLFQVTDSIGNSLVALKQIEQPCKQHVDNNFPPLKMSHRKMLLRFEDEVCKVMDETARMIRDVKYESYDEIRNNLLAAGNRILAERKSEMTKHESENIRAEILYLTILYEAKALLDSVASIAKSSRKFLTEKNS